MGLFFEEPLLLPSLFKTAIRCAQDSVLQKNKKCIEKLKNRMPHETLLLGFNNNYKKISYIPKKKVLLLSTILHNNNIIIMILIVVQHDEDDSTMYNNTILKNICCYYYTNEYIIS